MTREEMLADLAYARTLAEEGRHAPLIGGRYLVLFGALLCVAYLAHWALTTGVIAAPPWALGALWALFGVCAGIGCTIVYQRVRGLPGATALGNRIDRAVWNAATFAIFATVAGCLVSGALQRDPGQADVIMAVVFSIYGMALLTTAIIAEKAWLKWFAWAAFAVSLLLWLIMQEQWAYLAASAAALSVLVTPGIIMIRAEPSTTI
ncbi:MAG TPA: hypothetical protein PLN53_14540 [Terricaulis sp.]|nr:hypothetical protein [Terricaulis sp.]